MTEKDREGMETWSQATRTRVLVSMVVIGITAMTVLLATSVYYAISGGVLMRVLDEQFAATVMVPIAYISALILVLSFRVAAGPVEFKLLGLEFRGAAGPLVFWILCFLAIVLGFKMLLV